MISNSTLDIIPFFVMRGKGCESKIRLYKVAIFESVLCKRKSTKSQMRFYSNAISRQFGFYYRLQKYRSSYNLYGEPMIGKFLKNP